MTLAIFNLVGTMPVASERPRVCLIGVRMAIKTFLSKWVENPDMSGFFFILQAINARSNFING